MLSVGGIMMWKLHCYTTLVVGRHSYSSKRRKDKPMSALPGTLSNRASLLPSSALLRRRLEDLTLLQHCQRLCHSHQRLPRNFQFLKRPLLCMSRSVYPRWEMFCLCHRRCRRQPPDLTVENVPRAVPDDWNVVLANSTIVNGSSTAQN